MHYGNYLAVVMLTTIYDTTVLTVGSSWDLWLKVCPVNLQYTFHFFQCLTRFGVSIDLMLASFAHLHPFCVVLALVYTHLIRASTLKTSGYFNCESSCVNSIKTCRNNTNSIAPKFIPIIEDISHLNVTRESCRGVLHKHIPGAVNGPVLQWTFFTSQN